MAQAVWVYEVTDPVWSAHSGKEPLAVSVAQVSTAIVSNVLLIALPVWIIRKVRLNQGLRFRLVSVFSLSVITTLAAITHFVITEREWVLIAGVAEVFVSLSVCNAPVLIPAVLRQFSDSVTFVESQDHAVTTIGGSHRTRAGTVINLRPMNGHETPNIVVHVVVAVDGDDDLNKPTMWDRKDAD